MNLKKTITIVGLSLGVCLEFSIGCGVKGDPLPPDTPPRISRGKMTLSGSSGTTSVGQPKDGNN